MIQIQLEKWPLSESSSSYCIDYQGIGVGEPV